MNYINLKQQPQSSSSNNQTQKALNNKTDSSESTSTKKSVDTCVQKISKPDTRLKKCSSTQETTKTKPRGKMKSVRTTKTRKISQKSSNEEELIFKQVHQRVRDHQKSVASTSADSENVTKDSSCESDTEKLIHVKASTEVAKKTWSRVKKFGKEMRPLKKKSLNVSIESKYNSTPSSSNKKIIPTEMVNSQEIFGVVLKKNPSNLDHSFSEEKEEEDIVSRLSNKEVNLIIGIEPEEDSETGCFTPQHIISNQSFDTSDSENFKGFQNVSPKIQQIISEKTSPKDAKSTPEQVIESSNSEDERMKNLLISKLSLKRQSSNDTNSYKSSPEILKMPLSAVENFSTNEFLPKQIDLLFPGEQMDFTLPVSSIRDWKNNESNHRNEENNKVVRVPSQSCLLIKEPTLGVREVSNLSSKRIHEINSSEVTKTFVPFKKLGRIFFKKQRRIPFFYLGRLSNNHNFVERSNVTLLSPTKWEKKHLKRNFSMTNLSDSGFGRTRGNLTPQTPEVNNSEQLLQRTCSGPVILLSPQNDSQLRHLSIGSPHKEGELSVLETSVISRKDNECSVPSLERQKNFTPKARKNIAEKFEPLTEEEKKEELEKKDELEKEDELVEKEELGKKKDLIAEKEVKNPDYKKLFLDGSDFDIDTDKFIEFSDEVPKKPEEEEADKRKQESKLLQDTDSGSIVPSSLDKLPKKLQITHENFKSSFSNSPNSRENLQHFEYPGIPQRTPQIESQNIADRFFEDVIEKSKYIRANVSVDNVEANIEPCPKEIGTTEQPKVEKSSDSIKNIEVLNEPEIVTELPGENIEEMQIDSSSIVDSLHVNVNCPNEETQNSGSDKENTVQNSNKGNSSELFIHTVKPTQALCTSFERKAENQEAKETDRQASENVIEEFKTPENKKNRDEEILTVSKNKINVTPPDSLMNITEEQLMFNEFEKELFGGTKKARKGDAPLIPEGLKTLSTSFRVSKIISGVEYDLLADTLDDIDIIEDSPKTNRNIPEKIQLDKYCSDFSPIHAVGSSQSEKGRRQPSVKRKSCPLYHSTPKVPRIMIARCGTSLNSFVLLSSFQKPGPSNQEELVTAKPKLTFVCSGLSAAQIETVKQLAKLVNADFTSLFNPNVTHVIVKVTGPQNATEKTLKYVQGIAHKKWIVSVKWATDSLQESKLLNEEEYEVVDNLTLEEGPKKSRLRTRDIFEDFLCMCKGPFSNVSIEEYWVNLNIYLKFYSI